jgi:putative glutamine amidotransferase
VTGRTADGVAEAIEAQDHWTVGVQWHPEWSRVADPIFDWLVDVAGRREALAPRTTDPTFS